MTFVLEVDALRWRRHLNEYRDRYQAQGVALLPVVKSNGYGLGQARVAAEVTRLGLSSLAVGTVFEARELLPHFAGEVVVLEPLQPADTAATEVWRELAPQKSRLAGAVSSSAGADLAAELGLRVRFELATRMQRFGQPIAADNAVLLQILAAHRGGRLQLVGFTTHLSMHARVEELAPTIELVHEIRRQLASDLLLSVSHLSAIACAELVQQLGGSIEFRSGSGLWLGDRGALTAKGTVLQVGIAAAGPIGYHQHRVSTGWYAVVSGGSAHGVGLSAPAPTLRQRLVAFVNAKLALIGYLRSPFTSGGKKLRFVEPPHQQVSMLWLGSTRPQVGDELPVDVRFTTSHFDVVRGLD